MGNIDRACNHLHNTRNADSYVLPFHRTTLFERKASYIVWKLLYLLPGHLQNLTGDAMERQLHDFPVSRLVYSAEEFITIMREENR